MYNITFLTANGVDVDKSLELFGTIDTYNDTIGELILSIDEKINKLEEYKNKKDMHNYAIYAHSLKSDARYFGFTKLGDIAYEHELKSKEGDVFYIYNHFKELQDESFNSKKIINEYLSTDPQAGSGEEENIITIVSEPAVDDNNYQIYDKKTILVADDSSIVRNFVAKIFSDTYQVESAEDGEEALNIIKANKDNENLVAILLDLNMPVLDGFAVLDYMKENKLLKKIPVSIITGDSSKKTIDRAFTYNIVDMLGKPFADKDIKRVVEKTLYFKEMN